MQGQKKKVGDILIEAGIVDRFQLQAALAEQRKWGGRLGKHLVQMGILTDELLVKALSTQLRMPNLDLERLEDISSDVIDLVPRGVAEKFHLVPVSLRLVDGMNTLIVAISDPTDMAAIEELRYRTGYSVKPAIASDGAIQAFIERYYGDQAPGGPSSSEEGNWSEDATPQGASSYNEPPSAASAGIETAPSSRGGSFQPETGLEVVEKTPDPFKAAVQDPYAPPPGFDIPDSDFFNEEEEEVSVSSLDLHLEDSQNGQLEGAFEESGEFPFAINEQSAPDSKNESDPVSSIQENGTPESSEDSSDESAVENDDYISEVWSYNKDVTLEVEANQGPPEVPELQGISGTARMETMDFGGDFPATSSVDSEGGVPVVDLDDESTVPGEPTFSGEEEDRDDGLGVEWSSSLSLDTPEGRVICALASLLVEKGLISAEELARVIREQLHL